MSPIHQLLRLVFTTLLSAHIAKISVNKSDFKINLKYFLLIVGNNEMGPNFVFSIVQIFDNFQALGK